MWPKSRPARRAQVAVGLGDSDLGWPPTVRPAALAAGRWEALRGWLLLCLLCIGLGCRPQLVGSPGDKNQPTPSSTTATNDEDWRAALQALRDQATPTFRSSRAVGAAVCQELAALEPGQLKDLLLDSGIEREALPVVAGLQGLEHLRIRVTPINDQQLPALLEGSRNTLRILNLPQAELTSQGLRELRDLPHLRQVRLGGAQIDDEAARELARLGELRSLHLIGPSLTEEGLAALATSPKLASLYLDDCPLPDAAWQQLFEAKPGLHVHVDQQHHDRDPAAHEH